MPPFNNHDPYSNSNKTKSDNRLSAPHKGTRIEINETVEGFHITYRYRIETTQWVQLRKDYKIKDQDQSNNLSPDSKALKDMMESYGGVLCDISMDKPAIERRYASTKEPNRFAYYIDGKQGRSEKGEPSIIEWNQKGHVVFRSFINNYFKQPGYGVSPQGLTTEEYNENEEIILGRVGTRKLCGEELKNYITTYEANQKNIEKPALEGCIPPGMIVIKP